MTGSLTLSGAPVSNLHAASKLYVDTQVSSIDLSNYDTSTEVDAKIAASTPDLSSLTQAITTTGTVTADKILYSNMYATEGDLPSATTYHGMFAHVHATGDAYFSHADAWHKLATVSYVDNNAGSDIDFSTMPTLP